jgi:hypothetical protein
VRSGRIAAHGKRTVDVDDRIIVDHAHRPNFAERIGVKCPSRTLSLDRRTIGREKRGVICKGFQIIARLCSSRLIRMDADTRTCAPIVAATAILARPAKKGVEAACRRFCRH